MSTRTTPLANDIVTAIYLGAKMDLRSSTCDEFLIPQRMKSRQHSILSDVKKVLDSLAMLCVSKARMQVCAIGLRVTASEVELVVAENEKIAPETIKHLENMWSSLRTLSTRFEKCHPPLRISAAPRLPTVESLDPENRALFTDFRRMALKFGAVKLGRRLSKHFDSFKRMEVARDHFFYDTWQTVVILNDKVGEGKTPDEDEWKEVALFLDLLKQELDGLGIDYPERLISVTPRYFDVSKYLYKIVSVLRSIHILLQAANVPRLRGLFREKTLVITALEPISEMYEIPGTTSGWKEAITRILEERNQTRYYQEDELALTQITDEDAQYLAQESREEARTTNAVHPECRIIQHTFGPSAPRIYSYIGISKSSCCTGCWEYMQAVNTIHGTNLQTKDLLPREERTWRYPWAFAATTMRLSQRVAAVMYENVAHQIGRFYPGFRAIPRERARKILSGGELDLENDLDDELESDIIELLQRYWKEG